MGQQQLLLVILVTIIVGIATVVAINTFSSAADSANIDAVRQDAATIASSAQGYYMKPQMLGGGGKDFGGLTFKNISFPADSISTDGLTAMNANGVYVIGGGSAIADGAASFNITIHPASKITGAVTLTSTAPSADQLSATVNKDGMSWN